MRKQLLPRKAVLGVTLHAAVYEIQAGDRQRHAARDLDADSLLNLEVLLVARGLKGGEAGQDLEEDGANGPHVRAEGVLLSLEHFGRHVKGCATIGPCGVLGHNLGKPQVGDHQLEFLLLKVKLWQFGFELLFELGRPGGEI